jgi:hypothetical protein
MVSFVDLMRTNRASARPAIPNTRRFQMYFRNSRLTVRSGRKTGWHDKCVWLSVVDIRPMRSLRMALAGSSAIWRSLCSGWVGPVRLAASHLLAEFGGRGSAATADPGSAGGSNFESLRVITRKGPSKQSCHGRTDASMATAMANSG